MALEKELAYYDSIKDELIKNHDGKFALIVGEELLGVYDTPKAAYEAGTNQRGNVPMLIKRVAADETPEKIPVVALGLLSAHS
jgi:hypothetical protein